MTLYSDPSKMLNALQGFIKKHLMDLSSLFMPPPASLQKDELCPEASGKVYSVLL